MQFVQIIEHWSYVWSMFGVGNKTTRALSWCGSGVFVGSAWWFSCLELVLCCWLWTGSCLGVHSDFWFCSGWRLIQSCYLRAWISTFTKIWFLYYRLWTGFFSLYLYVFFCLAYSVISVLPCIWVGLTTVWIFWVAQKVILT